MNMSDVERTYKTLMKIKDKLLNMYESSDTGRRLFVTVISDGNGGYGTTIFTLEGTPAKGYAIQRSDTAIGDLFLWDAWFKKKYNTNDIVRHDSLKDIKDDENLVIRFVE